MEQKDVVVVESIRVHSHERESLGRVQSFRILARILSRLLSLFLVHSVVDGVRTIGTQEDFPPMLGESTEPVRYSVHSSDHGVRQLHGCGLCSLGTRSIVGHLEVFFLCRALVVCRLLLDCFQHSHAEESERKLSNTHI